MVPISAVQISGITIEEKVKMLRALIFGNVKSSLVLCFFLLAFSPPTTAATIKVGTLESYEEKKLDLPEAERADVVVHLGSAGDLVEGYRILLIRNSDRRPIKVGVSDRNGILRFENIAPGDYTAVFPKTKRQQLESTVFIGDIILGVHRAK